MNYYYHLILGKPLLKVLWKFCGNLVALSIMITLGSSLLFAVRATDGQTAYDQRQDDRMTASDERAKEIEGERKERKDENDKRWEDNTALINRIDDHRAEDHDRIVRDEAYISGALGLLSAIQIYIAISNNFIRRSNDSK